MNKDELESLRLQKPTFLDIAGNKKSYVCPVCGSGSGPHGSGLTTKDGKHWKCWGACNKSYDVIDLYAIQNGYANMSFPQKAQKCAEFFGMHLSNEGPTIIDTTFKPTSTPIEKIPPKDQTAFYQEAISKNDYRYLLSRGISEAVQRKFNIGFVPDWRSPKAVETMLRENKDPHLIPATPRCIIPRDKYSYLARDTRDNLEPKEKAYQKQVTGPTALFNLSGLNQDIVFIVEGEIDAMSIEEAGGNAVATCSTANIRMIIDYLSRNRRENQVFILMLDNDNAGISATHELIQTFRNMRVSFIGAVIPAGYKDPNDYLISDREGFKAFIQKLIKQAIALNREHQQNVQDLISYFEDIEHQAETLEVKTGFKELDRENSNLFGGLHEGLYIIGAVSSLGKTTFCLQLADQIAERGQDVIFFSLEQSKYELMAKSISRQTYINNSYRIARENGFNLAKETVKILNTKCYKLYCDEEKKAIKKAVEDYKHRVKDHLFIYEGKYNGERLTVDHMQAIVKNHIEKYQRVPVVFVDYLQIIGTQEGFKGTDKQATDYAVTELKEISRRNKTVVFAISSFNRENYNNPVTMQSFKESGAIEYSSDVLFGLQLEGMDKGPEEKDKDYLLRIATLKKENAIHRANKAPVRIQLKCLKNRNGNLFECSFNFVNAYNSYRQVAEQKPKKENTLEYRSTDEDLKSVIEQVTPEKLRI